MEEISAVSQGGLGELLPSGLRVVPRLRSASWVWASLLHPLQGQSEQTYSTVKTGAPAVTVTNLKPATRYVFQIRAASPGPSWEAQSFSPSIEVQTPREGKWSAWRALDAGLQVETRAGIRCIRKGAAEKLLQDG